MRSRCTEASGAPDVFEDLLKFVTTGNDDADTDGPKLKQQPKIIQIPVEKRVFVVPFDFKCHAILEAIHIVCR